VPAGTQLSFRQDKQKRIDLDIFIESKDFLMVGMKYDVQGKTGALDPSGYAR